MRKVWLLIICKLYGVILFSQISPGGIKVPAFWLTTDAAAPVMKPRAAGVIPFSFSCTGGLSSASFNYNPSLFFNSGRIQLDFSNQNLDAVSVFSVYKNQEIQNENIIWHRLRNGNAELVLSSRRMADIVAYQYLNFTDLFPGHPKINAFVWQGTTSSPAGNTHSFVWGMKPPAPTLPVNNFSGQIPELIGYNRILNNEERIRVSSYLALKYGITLSEPDASYLSSQGGLVWDGSQYPAYHHNIAGLVRDDSSGLNQVKASSENEPGLLIISTGQQLPDHSYIIWGDNGLPLSYEELPDNHIPSLLQRRGLIVSTSAAARLVVQVKLNTRSIDAPLPPDPVYWLAIDSSGEGNFSGDSVEFIRMNRVNNNKEAEFDNIQLKPATSRKVSFGWVIGKEILLSAAIINPTCASPAGGKIKAKAWGAQYPCEVTVTGIGTASLQSYTMTGSAGIEITGVEAGHFLLRIKDATGRVCTDSLYISNSDIPVPEGILPYYMLAASRGIDLDASVGMPAGISYEWRGPNGYYSNHAKVTLTSPGIYTLLINQAGCKSYQQIKLVTPPKNIFTGIQVYPNPSSGLFTVQLSLDKIADVKMNIYTIEGKLISERKLTGMANYNFSEVISYTGVYIMKFISGLDEQEKKIEIIKN